MSEPNPSVALLGNDGESRSLHMERFSLSPSSNIRKLRLQVLPRGGINPAALERLLGNTLPQSPQEKISSMPTAYWLGPNDWLLLDPAQEIDRIASALRESANGATSCVTDVTDAWSTIDMAGEDAPARLAEGCSVDLHNCAFPSGRYALTRLQHLSIIIHRLDDTPRFRILVDRSVAQFLRDWLEDER